MESTESSAVHAKSKDSSFCQRYDEEEHLGNKREWENDCEKFKTADPWYHILLFAADIVFVLCFHASLLLFADWILFVAPVIVCQLFFYASVYIL